MGKEPVQVNLKNIDGQVTKIGGLYSTNTFKELISKAAQVMGLQMDQLILVSAGKPLEEKDHNKTLDELGIFNNATLFSIIRLRG